MATNNTIKIQIGDEVRAATAEEIAEIQAAQSAPQSADLIAAKAAARQSALAKLAELGLTEEEIAAL